MNEMRLKYRGATQSVAGVIWRAEIWQMSDADFDVKELTFAGRDALKMEWPRLAKEEVLWGSAATLTVISETDREFIDLYSVEVGSVRLDVYRDGRLYWSGTMDTEFYEEPYETAYGYEVGLTFSDMGILDRLRYDLDGIVSIRSIVEEAIVRTGSATTGLNYELVSTTVQSGYHGEVSVLSYTGLAVRSDNFTDEEGEQSTWADVLKGVLRPLGIKMSQRYGCWHLYDLNGLYHSWSPQDVQWDGSHQTLGVDKVAKEVIITVSTYAKPELLPELKYEGASDVSIVNPMLEDIVLPDGDRVYSFWPRYTAQDGQNPQPDLDGIDFSIFLSSRGSGLAALGNNCYYGRILPVFGGADKTDCVVYSGWLRAGIGNHRWPHEFVNFVSSNDVVMRSKRVRLPRLLAPHADRYLLRLRQELVCDSRYNPFNDGDEVNDRSGNWEDINSLVSWAYVRCAVILYGDDGSQWYMSNEDAVFAPEAGNGGHYGIASMMQHRQWIEGNDEAGHVWLCYYDQNELHKGCPIGGWKTNRHALTPYVKTLAGSFGKIPDGEFMPYPPVGGEIEVRIMSGVGLGSKKLYADGSWSNPDSVTYNFDLQRVLAWMLYKAPELEIVNRTLVLEKTELDDVEYRGWVNRSAKDSISIGAVCGTLGQICPVARCVYIGADGNETVTGVTRAGKYGAPERLLIGTLCSQYVDRCLTLKGEARTDGGLHTYREQNQGNKIFMLMSDVQDAQSDCTDAEYCELRPDEYSARY